MSERTRLLGKIVRNKSMVIGGLIVASAIIVALLAPILPLSDPYRINARAMHEPPSLEHIFGTDGYGRDVLSRVIYGTRISLTIGFVVLAARFVVGVTLGVLAGYFGGWVDTVVMRITDVFLSIPTLLLAMAVMVTLGKSFTNLIIALAIKNWTSFARISRSEVLRLKGQDYIEAARATGVSHTRIILTHLIPNFASTLFVFASMNIAYPILGEAFLSFLGLGLDPPTTSWGYMLSIDRAYLTTAWWASVFPGLAILVLVLGFNMLGDGLRDVLDPTLVNVD
ncbi:ABC transporter permease [Candidatus Bipolaricaulota bacterium]